MTGVEATELRDVRTVPRLLAWRSSAQPDRVAIEVAGVATLTFAGWRAGSAAVAAALRQRGLRKGDRVGLVFGARDWTDFAVAYCGVQAAGGVAVPLSDRLAPRQLAYPLEHCSAAAVLHGSSTPAAPAGGWASTVADLVAGHPDLGAASDVEPTDLAQILYTSGTTGRPKGVGATHANLVLGTPTHPRRLALAHSQRFLHAFPIGTNAAQTMLLTALQAKPSALTLPQFTAVRFARLIEAAGVGSIFLVPSMAIELLSSGALRGRDLSGVHLIGSTAAPLAPAVATRLAEAFPAATIVNYYTSTEAAPAQTTMIFDPTRRDSVGRAVSGTLMIADSAGSPLPAGATGDVWLRSAHPRSYFRDEAASRATFRGEWVRMGDVGRLDDGYLYLSDRDEDVVKSGAFKVSTLEVEAALHEHPSVADVAVVGVPHPVLEAALAAFVVPRAGAAPSDLTLPAVREFLSARLAGHQLPARLLLLDRLPRNEAGKVLKRQLAAHFDGDTGRARVDG